MALCVHLGCAEVMEDDDDDGPDISELLTHPVGHG